MVSPDEACPNYNDIIRNFEEGHAWLWEQFGESITPQVGWQLDPFGHSAGYAHLYAEMGFESTVFTRINEDDEKNRLLERDEQFIWKPKFAFADATDKEANTGILGHKTFGGYGPPEAIPVNWFKDVWAGPILHIKDVNDSVCESMMQHFKHYKETRRTNQILVMYGQDFAHRDGASLDNLDELINALYAYADRQGLGTKYSF